MRSSSDKMLFYDLNLKSVDIVRPRCLWFSLMGIGVLLNVSDEMLDADL